MIFLIAQPTIMISIPATICWASCAYSELRYCAAGHSRPSYTLVDVNVSTLFAVVRVLDFMISWFWSSLVLPFVIRPSKILYCASLPCR